MIGITGASGVIIGIRLLQALTRIKYETPLVVSKWGRQTIELETKYSYEQISKMASIVHNTADMTACVSSATYARILQCFRDNRLYCQSFHSANS